MGMEGTLKNSAFFAVFVIAIIAFVVNFALDNDTDVTLDDDKYSTLKNTMSSDLDTLADESQTSQEIILKTTLESGDEHAGSGGQFKVGPFTAMGVAISATKEGFSEFFGGDSDFAFIPILFASIMTFLIGYYIVKAWLGRDPS